VEIFAFNSTDDMFESMERLQIAARTWAEANNAEQTINTHDYYYLWEGDLEIIGKKNSGVLPRDQYDSEEEYQYEIEITKESIKNGYVFGMWYSDACVEGELGSNHLSTLQVITERQFNDMLAEIQGE
jgi:hypothetical protein